ncbi:MAG: ferritin-like domain-containing protein [Candidatus Marinimicrobia bacterium]|nr:ferritin-like domain-containing protein [Candidatus Neomarinimicrobiota bacterium]MCK9483521.1 ferritin-like domain-containing protein [Candidatus Neomarinimicrobiota bacterium]MDD5539365.1 ferritin family protein [Candidatus Neomarinimicrobiota bacterium]
MMNRNQFENILDFAIEREWEAVRFYHRMLHDAPTIALMEAIREIELMERQHVEILEQFRKTGLTAKTIPEVENLQIGEYLVPSAENQNYREMLVTAMQREDLSYKLYKTLAEGSRDRSVANLFEKLAVEEIKHKNYFERLYDTEVLREN